MKIEESVLAVLSQSEITGNQLVLVGQLDRKLYERTNKVLEAAGGKWNRKLKAHVFPTDASIRLEQILVTGEVDIPKDEFNYFPTPAGLVENLVSHLDIHAGTKVLEPSAGKGAIASKCAELGALVDCYELMQDNYDALRSVSSLHKVSKADFLSVEPSPEYDFVVMNPPFFGQADVKHVMHAFKFLKPGGTLVSIMSNGVSFRTNRLTTQFREFVYDHGGVIDPLPDNSFKESGTLVNTVVVTIHN